jgi:hypothetical protein
MEHDRQWVVDTLRSLGCRRVPERAAVQQARLYVAHVSGHGCHWTGRWPGDGGSGAREGSLVTLLSGLRVRPGARPKATGQARWGTGVWMSDVRAARAGRSGPVMRMAASTAAQANAAAQIQLIWAKLDRNCAGTV